MSGPEGILVVDKPEGLTSYDVIRRIKRVLRGVRIGHAGTLDPMATGVLPVCLGRATKLVQFIMAGRKLYQGVIVLGISTNTYDREGEVTGRRPVPEDLDPGRVREAARRFTGRLRQVPPPYSAAKYKGVPLYKLARKGLHVEKEPKEIEIYSFEILDVQPPEVEFRLECSKGTYVRSLAADLGEALGTGAHLHALVRLASGPFSMEDARPLDEILELAEAGRIDEAFVPMEKALAHIPRLEVDRSLARAIATGREIGVGELLELMEAQGLMPEPGVPYVRLSVERPAGAKGWDTLAVAHWPEGRRGRVNLAKVFTSFNNILG